VLVCAWLWLIAHGCVPFGALYLVRDYRMEGHEDLRSVDGGGSGSSDALAAVDANFGHRKCLNRYITYIGTSMMYTNINLPAMTLTPTPDKFKDTVSQPC